MGGGLYNYLQSKPNTPSELVQQNMSQLSIRQRPTLQRQNAARLNAKLQALEKHYTERIVTEYKKNNPALFAETPSWKTPFKKKIPTDAEIPVLYFDHFLDNTQQKFQGSLGFISATATMLRLQKTYDDKSKDTENETDKMQFLHFKEQMLLAAHISYQQDYSSNTENITEITEIMKDVFKERGYFILPITINAEGKPKAHAMYAIIRRKSDHGIEFSLKNTWHTSSAFNATIKGKNDEEKFQTIMRFIKRRGKYSVDAAKGSQQDFFKSIKVVGDAGEVDYPFIDCFDKIDEAVITRENKQKKGNCHIFGLLDALQRCVDKGLVEGMTKEKLNDMLAIDLEDKKKLGPTRFKSRIPSAMPSQQTATPRLG